MNMLTPYGMMMFVYLPALLVLLYLAFNKQLKKYFATYTLRILIFVGTVYLFGLLGLLGYCLYYALYEFKSSLAVGDTATSKIVSAAQGYVEIMGQGKWSHALSAPISRTPCLWYQYSEQKNTSLLPNWLAYDADCWELISSGTSAESFLLSDGSAFCSVNPKNAQMSDLYFRQWDEDKYRYQEMLLLADKEVYVLGDFVTHTTQETQAKLNREVSAIMADWKTDQKRLKAQFDLNNDGVIDDQELTLVRAQAMREAKKNMQRKQAPKHSISAPKDGRPFIISHHPHQQLIKRHKMHSLFYILVFMFFASKIDFERPKRLLDTPILQHLKQ